MSARAAGFGVLALVGALLAASAVDVHRRWDELRPVTAGDRAPGFVLPRLAGGEPFSLAEVEGQVVLLDFWASWCGPCVQSMPAIERVARRYADRGLVVVSVNTEGADAAEHAAALLRARTPSAIGVSDDGAVSDRYKVTTIPHMVVVDRRGVVRAVHRGFAGAERLERDLDEAIAPLLTP